MEEWRDVIGYEGLYKVSNIGRVKRIKTAVCTPERVLKPQDTGVACTVVLHKNGKAASHRVHRLVAIAFIDNPNGYSDVNHIDGNHANNAVYNLEWCTPRHNAAHGTGRPVEITRPDGSIRCFPSVSAAARYLGCHMANIYYYAKNEVPTITGLRVRFADELKAAYRKSGHEVLNQ